eukprot:1864125-Rhodomonas_salina.2
MPTGSTSYSKSCYGMWNTKPAFPRQLRSYAPATACMRPSDLLRPTTRLPALLSQLSRSCSDRAHLDGNQGGSARHRTASMEVREIDLVNLSPAPEAMSGFIGFQQQRRAHTEPPRSNEPLQFKHGHVMISVSCADLQVTGTSTDHVAESQRKRDTVVIGASLGDVPT